MKKRFAAWLRAWANKLHPQIGVPSLLGQMNLSTEQFDVMKLHTGINVKADWPIDRINDVVRGQKEAILMELRPYVAHTIEHSDSENIFIKVSLDVAILKPQGNG